MPNTNELIDNSSLYTKIKLLIKCFKYCYSLNSLINTYPISIRIYINSNVKNVNSKPAAELIFV